MKAMILAAGRGVRMGSLTETTPKPLLKLGNRSLIEYHLLALQQAGVREVVINVCYLGEQIMQKIGDGSNYGLQIHYSDERAGCLETGGGILNALPLLGPKPFILVSADIVTNYNYADLPTSLSNLAHLIFVDNPSFHPTGDYALDENKIVCYEGNKLTYGNIAVLNPQLFADCELKAFPLSTLFRKAIDLKAMTGEHFHGEWHNVGTIVQLDSLQGSFA